MPSNVANPNLIFDSTDMKDMNKILQALRERTNAYKSKHFQRNNHVHRNTSIALGEKRNFKIDTPKTQTSSEEALGDILETLRKMGHKGSKVLEQVNEKYKDNKNNISKDAVLDIKARHYSKPAVAFGDEIDQLRRRKRDLILATALANNEDDEENDLAIEEVSKWNRRTSDHLTYYNRVLRLGDVEGVSGDSKTKMRS